MSTGSTTIPAATAVVGAEELPTGMRRPPDRWQAEAEQEQGRWWTHWAAWVLERSAQRKAPSPLGSRKHPIIEPAPGSYVCGLEPSTV